MTSGRGRLRRIVVELRRRHVIRVALAYAVFAFAVLQGGDLIIDGLGLPDTAFRALFIAVVGFFPVALVLSWVYDITPEGIRRTVAAEPVDAVLRAVPEKDAPIDSLAVLPFTHPADGEDEEYLCDGITESLINRMSALEGVRVVPRASAFRYKNRPVDHARILRELNVCALVTGKVHQRGDMLVAQAELVDLRTEAQLWGDHYNRPMSDIFTVQEEMAEEIARGLRRKLSGAQKERLMRRETSSPEAYQAYMRGRHHWNRRTAEGFRQAVAQFQRAIEVDPDYALAHAGLADTYNVMGYYNIEDPRDAYPRAKAAARRVLEIDATIAEAHASLGYATLFFDRDYDAAEAELLRAIALNASYATAHQWYGWVLLVRGRFDEMVEALERAVALDPLSLIINDHLGYALFLAGRYDQAQAQLRRTLDLDATYPLAHLRLGNFLLHQGRHADAVASLERSVELSGGVLGRGYLGQALALCGREAEARAVLQGLRDDEQVRYISPLDRALVHAGLGEVDAAVAALEEAQEHRTSDLVRLRVLPWPEELRRHPTFRRMEEELGLMVA